MPTPKPHAWVLILLLIAAAGSTSADDTCDRSAPPSLMLLAAAPYRHQTPWTILGNCSATARFLIVGVSLLMASSLKE